MRLRALKEGYASFFHDDQKIIFLVIVVCFLGGYKEFLLNSVSLLLFRMGANRTCKWLVSELRGDCEKYSKVGKWGLWAEK